MKNKIKFLNKKNLFAALISCALIFSALISYCNFSVFNWDNILNKSGISYTSDKSLNSEMCVNFLDVGKADCAFITCGENSILIDSGNKEISSNVTEYLKRRGTKKLDLVVASHPHRDHIGQMDSIIEEFKIDTFVQPDISENLITDKASYENMKKALSRRGVKSRRACAGDVLNIGDMKAEILGPIETSTQINNNSVVLKITYGSVSFLFTGDAQKEEEESIIKAGYNLAADVLKVGHHGSKTSSSYKFLTKVRPRYAVISVAPDKSNLPKEKVLKRLSKFCDKIYRTDLNGHITVKTHGNEIEIETEK